jgi:solute carrier family 25 carnitine/acylcarnitine transporter 20/29
MQAQSGFLEGGGTLQALRKVWRAEGVRGLYRGWIPPLWGSGLYRSTQFAVFEALFTKWDANRISTDPLSRPAFAADVTRRVNLNTVIPGTFGLETRVVEAALCASFARAVIESPIEYAKVARQTGQSWALRSVYTGFGPQFVRTAGVMTTYFVLIDSIRRHAPATFANPLGQFLASSCSATLGFWIVWPAEVLKNQVQARTPIYSVEELRNRGITGAQIARACNGGGAVTSPSAAVVAAASPSAAAAVAAAAAAAAAPSASFLPSPLASPTLADRARYLLFTHGIAGLYRGIGPGTARSMLSNGVSMIVMLHAQRKITEWGWRN